MEKRSQLDWWTIKWACTRAYILCGCLFCCQFHLSLSFIFSFLAYIAFKEMGMLEFTDLPRIYFTFSITWNDLMHMKYKN